MNENESAFLKSLAFEYPQALNTLQKCPLTVLYNFTLIACHIRPLWLSAHLPNGLHTADTENSKTLKYILLHPKGIVLLYFFICPCYRWAGEASERWNTGTEMWWLELKLMLWMRILCTSLLCSLNTHRTGSVYA